MNTASDDLPTDALLSDGPGAGHLATAWARIRARLAEGRLRDELRGADLLNDAVRNAIAAGLDGVEVLSATDRTFEMHQGGKIEVKHPLAELLREKATEGGPDPAPLLSIGQLFGELGQDERLVASLRKWLGSFYKVGSLKTLERAADELGF